ncbi:MAG: site-specific integrase, partial [Acidobacteria bacterium]|nr:site-specific integrase [Acidobacteriota bacterium]
YKAGSSKRAAERLRLRIESEINEGKHNPVALRQELRGGEKRGLTFGNLVEQFLASYRSRGRSRYYAKEAKIWLAYFGSETLVSDIGAIQVERFRNERLERVGPSSVRKDLISLGTLFRWAMKRGLVSENPADPISVKRPPEPAGESRGLTTEEYERLVSLGPNWLSIVVAWACNTGMDKGMVFRIRWSDLDLQRTGKLIVAGTLKFLRGKTGKPVRQILSSPAIDALNQAQKVRHTSRVVFLNDSSQPIEEKALDWALAKAFKAAGLQGVSFRTFRHTFATWALRSDVHPTVLAKMMGHSTTFITERYMHVADDMLAEAARKMSGSNTATRRRPKTKDDG